MGMIQTEKGTKKFTEKEKLSILKEAEKEGVKKTLGKYNLYPATYYYWKKKYSSLGSDGNLPSKGTYDASAVRKLEKENAALKQLLAEKELESKLKDEMLKKKYPHLRKLL
ncbi:putative transposase [Arachidicoccus rhizosphaerae]|uniref:Putative transposase n=1 Tax=Arachidicoccus rhizosphaerae TaxID=551991 RepID=A0A1H4CSP6_9BACT|nr:transposase [Arachidicoccus rhizosphaerae]SEA63397.1 putative transposase [Arachidicoccus rhizosphaerae]